MIVESTLVQTMTQQSKRFWLPESAPGQRHFSEWFLLEGLLLVMSRFCQCCKRQSLDLEKKKCIGLVPVRTMRCISICSAWSDLDMLHALKIDRDRFWGILRSGHERYNRLCSCPDVLANVYTRPWV